MELNAIEPGIYQLLKKGKIVYIGRARNVFTRVATHMSQRRIDFDTWTWERVEDENVRWEREAGLIKEHQPKYNVMGCCNYPIEREDVIAYRQFRSNGKVRYSTKV
jgi:excinuclease UvrABC nuclease subunit